MQDLLSERYKSPETASTMQHLQTKLYQSLFTKSSRDIAKEIKKIYERDGPPDRLQSDHDLEFHECVENICKKYKFEELEIGLTTLARKAKCAPRMA